jgi:N-acetylglucosaminyldiphosphoundecaprenol N-acetyl-beta-D-mannosaminyltransferase
MPESLSKHLVTPRAREEIFRRFSSGGLRRQRLRRFARVLWWELLLQAVQGSKRTIDVSGAVLLLLVFSPLWILGFFGAFSVIGTTRLGRWCAEFRQYAFDPRQNFLGRLLTRLGLLWVPSLFNVLRGDMSLIGPRAAAPGELSQRERMIRRRYNIRPGLICSWWIRRQANIAFGEEAEADVQYVETRSLKGDLGIALRAIPAILYGEGVASAPDNITLLGIPINNLTMNEALDMIDSRLDRSEPFQICFVNADCANLAQRNRSYYNVLLKANCVLADGIGVKLAGRLLGTQVKQNVNGTDLFPRLCARLSERRDQRGLFLLGGQPGVAERVKVWVESNYPNVSISGFQDGYFSAAEEQDVIRRIAESGAKILLVALGAPRQDLWIAQHLQETGVTVAMGVGGLFDFFSGRIPRAPQWMREICMEWMFRFWQEPRRMWKRYFVGNSVFLIQVLRERLGFPGSRCVLEETPKA